LITGPAFFRSSVLGNVLGRDRVGPEVLYLLGLDGVELGVLGEFWRKISLA
jgi:hypothetical protein